MRALLAFAVAIFIMYGTSWAQSKVKFNHNALMVSDLDASSQFYRDILGLEEIDNPTGNPGIRWFSLGGELQLHLITGNTEKVAINKTIHMAVSLGKFDQFVSRLKQNQITYSSWEGEENVVTIRPDKVKQIYVQDPDGYWIEINDAI